MKFANLTWGQRGYLLLVVAIIAGALWLNYSLVILLFKLIAIFPLVTFILTYILLWAINCFRLLFVPTNAKIDGLINGLLLFMIVMVGFVTGTYATQGLQWGDLLWSMTDSAGVAYYGPLVILILRFCVKTPPFRAKLPRAIALVLLLCAAATPLILGGLCAVSATFALGETLLWQQGVIYWLFLLVNLTIAVLLWLKLIQKLSRLNLWLAGCEVALILLFGGAWLIQGSIAVNDVGGMMLLASSVFAGVAAEYAMQKNE